MADTKEKGDAEQNPYQCPDCREAMRMAYSDATTPGFYYDRCERHRTVKPDTVNDGREADHAD